MSVFDIPAKTTGDTVTAQELNDIVAAAGSYKSYVALLKQSDIEDNGLSTDAPRAAVYKNTIGEPTFQRVSAGNYKIIFPADSLTLQKTVVVGFSDFDGRACTQIPVFSYNEPVIGYYTMYYYNDGQTVWIQTFDATGNYKEWSAGDLLAQTSIMIEIRVYI